MESKDRIPQNFDVLDLSRAMNSFKREQIRKILELPDHQSFSGRPVVFPGGSKADRSDVCHGETL